MKGSNKKKEEIKYKVCPACGRKLRLTTRNFHKHRNSSDGFQAQCKKCSCDYQRSYYKIQKELVEQHKDTIIRLAFDQEMDEHSIGKLLELPPSKVWDVIVKERYRRKRETLKKLKELQEAK